MELSDDSRRADSERMADDEEVEVVDGDNDDADVDDEVYVVDDDEVEVVAVSE